MIPPIPIGDTQNDRQGIKVNVLKLQTHLDFSIRDDATRPSATAWNLMFVVYIWQHKQYKSYKQLELNNNFDQFLDRGNGTTGNFTGLPCDAKLPLAKDHYKLCRKFVFPIRTDGSANGAVTGTNYNVSNGNAAPFSKRITLDLTKYIPKKLQYPVATSTDPDPVIDSYPTNSSLCMSVGFYDMTLVTQGDVLAQPLVNTQYVTTLTFKDP